MKKIKQEITKVLTGIEGFDDITRGGCRAGGPRSYSAGRGAARPSSRFKRSSMPLES